MNASKLFCHTAIIFSAFLLCCSISITSIYAGEGDGSGGGTGGGKDQPVVLVTSSPESGSSGVSVDTKIKLDFNKNVVNMTVKENNMKCFKLQDQMGNNVGISVEMADDQINPEYKRNVVIKPINKLKEGTIYTLTINKKLKAKNANNLADNTEVTFRCAGKVSAENEKMWKAIQSKENPNEITIYVDGATQVNSANPGVKDKKGATETRTSKEALKADERAEKYKEGSLTEDGGISKLKELLDAEPHSISTYVIIAGLIILVGLAAAIAYVKRNERFRKTRK